MSAVESSPYTPFTISVVPHRDEVAAVLRGELDMASADELVAAVDDLKRTGFDRVVLNLRDVDFIDSTGLRTLISLRNDAKRNGHALTLLAPAPAVGRIFDITGTRGLFDWRDRFPH